MKTPRPELHGAPGQHALFDHLIRPLQQRLRDRDAERLRVLRFTVSSNFIGSSTGRVSGFSPFRIRVT